MNTNRRQLLLAGAALALPFAATAQNKPAQPVLQVWKDPNCGCCQDWVVHLQANGFAVQVFDSGNTAMRRRLQMPERYGLMLLWRYWEHRSARDMAVAIGTTEKSVERLLARARARFKELWLKE